MIVSAEGMGNFEALYKVTLGQYCKAVGSYGVVIRKDVVCITTFLFTNSFHNPTKPSSAYSSRQLCLLAIISKTGGKTPFLSTEISCRFHTTVRLVWQANWIRRPAGRHAPNMFQRSAQDLNISSHDCGLP